MLESIRGNAVEHVLGVLDRWKPDARVDFILRPGAQEQFLGVFWKEQIERYGRQTPGQARNILRDFFSELTKYSEKAPVVGPKEERGIIGWYSEGTARDLGTFRHKGRQFDIGTGSWVNYPEGIVYPGQICKRATVKLFC